MAHKRPEKTSGNQDVIDAAFARKDGGAVPALATGGPARDGKGRFKKGGVVPALKTGGKVVAPKLKEGGKVEGRKAGGRLDKFARGGACADKSPYSSAKLD